MSNEPRYFNRSPQVLLVALACLLTGANVAVAGLNDGLVGYWSFDEGEGSIASDYSGNSNHGTINGAGWTIGVSGFALLFDGTDDYIDCGSDATLDIVDEITISAWIKTSDSSRQSIVSKMPGGSAHPANYHIGVKPEPYFEHTDGEWHIYSSSHNVCDGEWHHVTAVVKSGHWWKVYVDGALSAGDETTYMLQPTTAALQIGQWPLYVPDRSFNGVIDEVRIYSRALGADEVQALWACWIGHWSFDEGEGGTAYDYSGHGNHGTIYGPTWTTGMSGTALHFDGLDDYVDCGNSVALDATGDITICAWVRTSVNSRQSIVTKTPGGDARPQNYHFGLDTSGSACWPYFEHSDEDCGTYPWHWYRATAYDVCDGRWHLLAAVVKARQSWEIYIDGQLAVQDQTDCALRVNDDSLHIGQWPGHVPERNFCGDIDELSIYRKALGADDIRDLYWSVNPDPQDDTTVGDKSDVSGTSTDPVNTATGSFFYGSSAESVG
ncbi:MAG: LamG domain-containing protein, partial [Phycisphaerae bacterium]|nr:LamG domain-containing protein [Phycisphaerae bacterium]